MGFWSRKNIEERKEKPEMCIYENDGSIETPVEDQIGGHIVEYKYLVDCIFKDQLINIYTSYTQKYTDIGYLNEYLFTDIVHSFS